ncbi:hypothetical protein HDV62DRAFT_245200 [Trichoderma sp. SZMC 28011]
MTTYENICHPQGAFYGVEFGKSWSFLVVILFSFFSSFGIPCILFLFSHCSFYVSIFIFFFLLFVSHHVCFGGVSLKLVRRHGADIGICIDRKSWTIGRKKGKMSLLHMEIGSVIGAMLRQFNIYHVQ